MDQESRAGTAGVVVSLDTFRAERTSREPARRKLAVPVPFKPKSLHGDAGLREAEGQLDFIALALDVEERIAGEDRPERWASAVAYHAQRQVREERIARYLGEAEGARRYILEQPAAGGSGAAVKLRMALTQGDLPPDAERLVRDALKALAPTRRAAATPAAEQDGAA